MEFANKMKRGYQKVEYTEGKVTLTEPLKSERFGDAVDGSEELTETRNINYRFREDEIIQILKDYIDSTYSEHYVPDAEDLEEMQTIEAIDKFACPARMWTKGEIFKYVSRQGDKKGHERKDLLKILHYAVLLYHFESKHLDKEDIA